MNKSNPGDFDEKRAISAISEVETNGTFFDMVANLPRLRLEFNHFLSNKKPSYHHSSFFDHNPPKKWGSHGRNDSLREKLGGEEYLEV